MSSTFVARVAFLGCFVLAAVFSPLTGHAQQQNTSQILVDDFESYAVDDVANEWKYVTKEKEQLPAAEALEEGERFHVREESGNKYLHVRTEKESMRLSKVNGDHFDWNLKSFPRLQWRWRAQHLPKGANEREKNDTGAALYVTFDTDWLGRPKSIKYTYSSSLPVGTVVDFGKLYVIVVSSPKEGKIGEWKTIERNLIEDYKKVFGGLFQSSTPPDRPLSITIWSDSDTTGDYAEADFDDIKLLPPSE